MGGSWDWDYMHWLGAPRAVLLRRPPPPFSCALLFPGCVGIGISSSSEGAEIPPVGSSLDVLSVCSSRHLQHPHDGYHWAGWVSLLMVVLGSQELPWPELPLSGDGLSASQAPSVPFVLQIPLLMEPTLQSCIFSSSRAESEILRSSK